MRILPYIATLAIFLAGCAHPQLPPEARVNLQAEGAQSAIYHRSPLKVYYDYQLTDSDIKLQGHVSSGVAVDTLYLRIAFFDSQGKALGQELIYASGHRTRSGNDSFNVTVQVPAGTTSFGFTSSEQQRSGNRN